MSGRTSAVSLAPSTRPGEWRGCRCSAQSQGCPERHCATVLCGNGQPHSRDPALPSSCSQLLLPAPSSHLQMPHKGPRGFSVLRLPASPTHGEFRQMHTSQTWTCACREEAASLRGTASTQLPTRVPKATEPSPRCPAHVLVPLSTPVRQTGGLGNPNPSVR